MQRNVTLTVRVSAVVPEGTDMDNLSLGDFASIYIHPNRYVEGFDVVDYHTEVVEDDGPCEE